MSTPPDCRTCRPDEDPFLMMLGYCYHHAPEAPDAWPKVTPSGHVYEVPATYEDLCQRHADAAQAMVEGWDAEECPPDPTWEVLYVAHEEIRYLREVVAMMAEDYDIPSLIPKEHAEVIARAVDHALTAPTERPTAPEHNGSCSDLAADATKRTGREG